MITTHPELTADQIEALGKELDAIRQEVVADLGQRDADYIRNIIDVQRKLEVAGRAFLWAGIIPPFWLAGVASLGAAKILDNMEIGHNVMHGQYDWMQDPELTSKNFEWDNTISSDSWRYTHNYVHHTYTNIVGKDHDASGYGVMRMTEETPWHPVWLLNPVFAILLQSFFQWGTALQEAEAEKVIRGEKSFADARESFGRALDKGRKQALKDYLIFPALSGPFFPVTFAGNVAANFIRNIWSSAVIFNGHFPANVQEFSIEETENESKGAWYYRQILGSANFHGGRLMHIMSGNLSFQIEHHLFPDVPAHRYAEMSPKVQEVCAKYGLPYNTGSFLGQFGSVYKKIFRLALPDGRKAKAQKAELAKASSNVRELVAA
ncbi:acyl-CoA desaturase [Hoyosella rhizosphaerae]|uniref:Fatty acid desaturase n=1 Tax=Hoyosella rhizosphaerae TaxID=1755582 RepID=A0A916X914_9ACTN|nr:acyl-CoA desaturase [Hoyosella rhizosphaerae]MBN4927170.1 acyl-CoA desaturase [Hoyosella rhizosphaerae]GGC53462.1 fatty acid desaturase [Hoyosella rhizosphaerae]